MLIDRYFRKSRAPNVERMYEGMCEENFRSLIREELQCLSTLERDQKLRECFVNRTNTLRDEDPANPPKSDSYSSYECLITQIYVDCLLERQDKSCKEAIKKPNGSGRYFVRKTFRKKLTKNFPYGDIIQIEHHIVTQLPHLEMAMLSMLAARNGSQCVLQTIPKKRPAPAGKL
ncbi:unnamed protein product [Cylicostephanus goldi]|uniref:Uncharacterized protein n=1 Tax=Cylicostephanus goldi TaxID=71465 RepID=A0A3P6TDS8_CYLGO|nr:unnamed protein product [Cylicostephanus goldi]